MARVRRAIRALWIRARELGPDGLAGTAIAIAVILLTMLQNVFPTAFERAVRAHAFEAAILGILAVLLVRVSMRAETSGVRVLTEGDSNHEVMRRIRRGNVSNVAIIGVSLISRMHLIIQMIRDETVPVHAVIVDPDHSIDNRGPEQLRQSLSTC